MPSRNLFQYFLITAKGVAMGAADVVPGVSGGTIAFISGIYEELISTIHRLDFGFITLWKKDGLKKAWNHYNLSFLAALFLGVLVSILSLAKIITLLLKEHPILVWSFFFGLVVASILFVGKQIKRWSIRIIISLIIASAISYGITLAEPVGSPESIWFLFFAGFIAIIAMILPGISGAFILLLLGAYQSVLGILTEFSEGIFQLNWALFSQAFLKLLIFAAGAIVGIKVFSRALNWMFDHHKDLILAILTGFMVGALNKIWPWKRVLEYRMNSHGEDVPFLERSILPNSFEGDPLLIYGVIFMILGYASITILERISVQKKNQP